MAGDTAQWEVSGASYITLASTSNGTLPGAQSPNPSQRSINLGTDVDYYFATHFSADLLINASLLSSASQTTTLLNPMVGASFNFLGNPTRAAFVQVALGLERTSNGAAFPNTTQFSYLVGVGKRFELATHLAYKPQVAIQYLGATTATDSSSGLPYSVASSTIFSLVPVQFCFLF